VRPFHRAARGANLLRRSRREGRARGAQVGAVTMHDRHRAVMVETRGGMACRDRRICLGAVAVGLIAVAGSLALVGDLLGTSSARGTIEASTWSSPGRTCAATGRSTDDIERCPLDHSGVDGAGEAGGRCGINHDCRDDDFGRL
jgi:hypothetical protein